MDWQYRDSAEVYDFALGLWGYVQSLPVKQWLTYASMEGTLHIFGDTPEKAYWYDLANDLWRPRAILAESGFPKSAAILVPADDLKNCQ